MRFLKKYWLLFFILLSCMPIARFCHNQTEGMILTKFLHNTSPSPGTSPPLPDVVKDLLNQKFTYFSRGLQSFSFLSEDGKTVLKIFNNRYQRRLFFLKLAPIKNWKTKREDYNRAKWAKTFTSYQLAFNLLKKETGLIYLQLNPTLQSITTILIDKLGIAHKINLGKMAFALQRKCVMAYDYLDRCSNDEAKDALQKIVLLTHHKMKLGLHDNDPLTRTNLGFLDGEPMQIDLGPFTKKETLNKRHEVERNLLSLKHWLEKHHPEYVGYFNETLQDL